jgi:hypothetical protein
MSTQGDTDPAWDILANLDQTGFHRLINNWKHKIDFAGEVRLLVLGGLDTTLEGIENDAKQETAALDKRAGPDVDSERYEDELQEIQLIADQRTDFACNLFFTGLMDTLARRLSTMAWQIEDSKEYLAPDADMDDPRARVAGLTKMSSHGEAELDWKKISEFDRSGGRLPAARAARNLLVHPCKPLFDIDRWSKKQKLVREHLPDMISDRGQIVARRDRIEDIANDSEILVKSIADEHQHGWLMLRNDRLSRRTPAP